MLTRRLARAGGLSGETIQALATGELSAAEQAAWRFAHQLTTSRRVEQPVYDQALAAFGTHGIADMVLLIGAYQTVCPLLNAFEIPAPRTSRNRTGSMRFTAAGPRTPPAAPPPQPG